MKRRAIWAILMLRLVLSLWYCVQTPLWHSDEFYHYLVIRVLGVEKRLPTETDFAATPLAYHIFLQYQQPRLYYLLLAPLAGWLDTDPVLRVNANPIPVCALPTGYSPVFIHSAADDFPGEGGRRAVWMMRLVTIGFGVAGTAVLGFGLAPLLGEKAALFAASALALTPVTLQITAWVNNDSLTLLWGACFVVALVRLYRRKVWGWDAFLLFAAALLCAMTKLTGFIALPVAALATIRRVPWLWWLMWRAIALLMGALLIWGSVNALQCGKVLCRIHRETFVFDTLEALQESFLSPIYIEAAVHVTSTLLVPPITQTLFPPLPFMGLAAGLMLIGAVGSLRGVVPLWGEALWGLFAAAVLMGLARVWWLQASYFHARYLAVAIPGLCCLVGWGWLRWGERQAVAALALACIVAFISPLYMLRQPYSVGPLVSSLPPTSHPLDIRFTSGLSVEAYEILPQTPPVLRLYWRAASADITPHYAFITLYDENHYSLTTCSFMLGRGILPPSLWGENWMIQDYPMSEILFAKQVQVDLYSIYESFFLGMNYDPTLVDLPLTPNHFHLPEGFVSR